MSTEMRDVSRKEVSSDRRKNTTLSIPLFMGRLPHHLLYKGSFWAATPRSAATGGGLTSGNETSSEGAGAAKHTSRPVCWDFSGSHVICSIFPQNCAHWCTYILGLLIP